jgi:uncharacterized membrane protein YhiD involved in acid resistance
MATGGGLYLTACFATVIILLALALLGRMERAYSLRTIVTTYEVTGRNVDSMLREMNRILDDQKLTMQRVHLASADPDFRIVFTVDCERDEHNVFSLRLHESNVFASVNTLGTTERE